MDDATARNQVALLGVVAFGCEWWLPMSDALLRYRPPSNRDDREERDQAKRAVLNWLKFRGEEPVWMRAAIPLAVTTLIHRRRTDLEDLQRAAIGLGMVVDSKLVSSHSEEHSTDMASWLRMTFDR